jgi:hypothetical protein
MRINHPLSIGAVAALAMAGALPLAAQEAQPQPVRLQTELSVLYARPLGEFADHIDRGFGLAFGVSVPLAENSPFSLRLDGGVINYGHETRQVCLSSTVGCRVRVDLTTTNDIAFAAVGPQLAVPRGPVRPYLHASAGFAYFGTSSAVSGRDDHHDFARTINQDDLTFSWGVGGGVRVALPVAATPVLLDLGARYHDNARVEYLREGGITDLPDGTLQLDTQRSRADLITFHL